MDHQAFAQLLGNYGEFVGAIAVVATLAYLALQIRQSKSSTDSATFVSIIHGLNEGSDVLVNDESVVELYIRGMNDPGALTPTEEVRFFFLVRKSTNLLWTLFMLHHHRNLSTELWLPWDGVTRNWINAPGVKYFLQTQFNIDRPGMEGFFAYCQASWDSDNWDGQTFLGSQPS